MEFRKHHPQPSAAQRRRGRAERRRRGQQSLVAARRGGAARERREIGRYSCQQGFDDEHPAGAADEGPHLHRGFAADRRTQGELGRDGLPTYFTGKLTAGEGHIIDTDKPDYPMAIDSAEISVEWDSGRRVLVAPFKIISGANRVTLLAHLE